MSAASILVAGIIAIFFMLALRRVIRKGGHCDGCGSAGDKGCSACSRCLSRSQPPESK